MIELVVKFSFIRACVVQMLFCQKGAQKYNFENFYFNTVSCVRSQNKQVNATRAKM